MLEKYLFNKIQYFGLRADVEMMVIKRCRRWDGEKLQSEPLKTPSLGVKTIRPTLAAREGKEVEEKKLPLKEVKQNHR